MATRARLDLKLEKGEKETFSQAAALMGKTMAGFVRAAAKEKAQTLLEEARRVTLSPRDFATVAAALDRPFAPNKALRAAMKRARRARSAEPDSPFANSEWASAGRSNLKLTGPTTAHMLYAYSI